MTSEKDDCPRNASVVTRADMLLIGGLIFAMITIIFTLINPSFASTDRVNGIQRQIDAAERRLEVLERKLDAIPAQVVELLEERGK